MKTLKVIRLLQKSMGHKITVVPTFLGAHTIPPEYKEKRREYVNMVIGMLPEIKGKGLAEFVDVFCDKLGFTRPETEQILKTAQELGFKLKIHVDQTGESGGSKLMKKFPFTSMDHLDYLSAEKKFKTDTVGVLLPGVTYHLMEVHSKNFWTII